MKCRVAMVPQLCETEILESRKRALQRYYGLNIVCKILTTLKNERLKEFTDWQAFGTNKKENTSKRWGKYDTHKICKTLDNS